MPTILLTGIPRSGTTLVCACLNAVDDCVALVEPMVIPTHGDIPRAVAEITDFAAATRARILAEGRAPSAAVNGRIVDNMFEDARTDGGLRRHVAPTAPDLLIDKPLSHGFRLVIKHPAIFTALAEPLAERLPLFAVVRHPLAVLASWQSVDFPARLGRLPAAEAFVPGLRERLDGLDDPLQRQIALIRWFFSIYRDAVRPDRVLSYEAVIADPGRALAVITQPTAPLDHPTRQFDPRTRYPTVDLSRIARALLAAEAEVEPFYPGFAESLRPYLAS